MDRVGLIVGRESGRSRGSVFVAMPQEDEVRDAVAALGGGEVQGRAPAVNQFRFRPRAPRPNRRVCQAANGHPQGYPAHGNDHSPPFALCYPI